MAITALSGQTKAASQKTSQVRKFGVKEDSGDSYVYVPPAALKSVECKVKGQNEEQAFGQSTIGQKVEGHLILYGAEAAIRTFAHELVTKTIEAVEMTTNSGIAYTFSTSDSTPALEFFYDEASLVTGRDGSVTIKLNFEGFRDNLAIS